MTPMARMLLTGMLAVVETFAPRMKFSLVIPDPLLQGDALQLPHGGGGTDFKPARILSRLFKLVGLASASILLKNSAAFEKLPSNIVDSLWETAS